MTNRQRVFDLLAGRPTQYFTKDEIMCATTASPSSVADSLTWLRKARKITRHHDHDHPKPGPHYRYRIVENASRPPDGRLTNGFMRVPPTQQ